MTVVEIVVMVQRPEGIEPLDFGLAALLPVDPPEVHALLLIGVVQDLEIGLNEFGICDIEGDRLAGFRIDPHGFRHHFIAILEAAYPPCGMDVERCVEILLLEPAQEGTVIRKKLCVPAISRPSTA